MRAKEGIHAAEDPPSCEEAAPSHSPSRRRRRKWRRRVGGAVRVRPRLRARRGARPSFSLFPLLERDDSFQRRVGRSRPVHERR